MIGQSELALLFFLQEDWEGVIAIVGGLGIVIAIALLIYLSRVKGREFSHKERMALIERAESLPENIDRLLGTIIPAPDQDLRAGLLWGITGLGVSLILYLLADTRPYWPIGLIPVFIGLAYLVSFGVLIWRQRGGGGVAKAVQIPPPQRELPEGAGTTLFVEPASEEEEIKSQ